MVGVSVEDRWKTLQDSRDAGTPWDIFPVGGKTSGKNAGTLDLDAIYHIDDDFAIIPAEPGALDVRASNATFYELLDKPQTKRAVDACAEYTRDKIRPKEDPR